MSEFNSIDDFLNHKGNSGRSGGRFLRDWKANGKIDIWLHTRRLPLAIWQHRFPRLFVREDKETREVDKFFSTLQAWNCWEDESVLRAQWKRNVDGTREVPPRACPLCRLIEHIRLAVDRGDIAMSDPVFEFRGSTDPDKDRVVHAGGIAGLFTDKLSNEDKNALKKRGIFMSEAWKETSLAKLSYIFCVVDHAHPELGVQIDVETQLVGDKVKAVIVDQMESKPTPDLGNPMITPYCIQLRYSKDEVAFAKRYHARPLERNQLNDQIEALIRSEPPDLSHQTRPFSAAMLRSVCEQYAVMDLPWDEIFEGAEEYDRKHQAREEAGRNDEDAAEDPEEILKNSIGPKEARGETSRRQIKPPSPPPSSPAVETVPCDRCHAPMGLDQAKCGKCGAEYEVDEPPPEPKKVGKGKGAKIGW